MIWETANLDHVVFVFKFHFAIQSHHNVSVQFCVGGAISTSPEIVKRVVLDDVVSSNQVNWEAVHQDVVFGSRVHSHNMSIFIEFWSQESADDSFSSNISIDVVGHGEWFVVQTHTTAQEH